VAIDNRNSPPLLGNNGSGVKIEDLLDSRGFLSRPSKETTAPDRDVAALARLKECLAHSPDSVLQELVQIAVDFSGADSSGISLEEENENGELQFRWIAVAGSFALYLNGTTPRFYSPCGTCIDRGVPQLYEVTDPYYNFLGVTAQPILDGILIPWRAGHNQGTIWLVSHQSSSAFDQSDYQFIRNLANFISTDVLIVAPAT
jgi:hypothetical protein